MLASRPLLLGLAALCALLGCSADDNPDTLCTVESGCLRPDGGNDIGTDIPRAGDAGSDVAPVRQLRSLAIRPPSATLRVVDGVPETQDFTVIGTLSDGTQTPVGSVVWSLPPGPIASIQNSTGRVTATGTAGGAVMVHAEVTAGGTVLTADARVDVTVARSIVAMGAPVGSPERFAGTAVTDAARAPVLRYPLNHAVMPDNVAPPDVQWEGGAAGDIYRVRLQRPHVEVAGYVVHAGASFRYDWVVDAEAWRALLESDRSEDIVVTVDRWDHAHAEVISGSPVSLRIARGSISGSLYYWDLSDGRIQRIDAITAERSVAVPSPPERPAAIGTPNRCIACHTVSRDGRYLSVEMWDGGGPGAAYDLTSADLRNDPAPTVFGPSPSLSYLFASFSPDSNYLVINRGNELALLRRAGAAVVPSTGLPTAGAAHPDWSPDGMSVAYIANTDGTWGVDFTRGDLAVIPRTGETQFGAPRTIHVAASSPGGPVDAHPSFSPDSRWVAFQHGQNSRSGLESVSYPGRLEMVSADGGAPVALDNANGGEPSSYWPNFSPFNVGGYFWVAFYSRRDYGNAQAGTRGTRRRQIWVTAIANHPTAGSDPSSVPYWLPGQSVGVENISAYWAQVACRMTGEACRVSSECCTGACTRGTDGMYSCTPPAPMACRSRGATCSSTSDCCAGLECAARVCATPPG